MAKGQWNHKIFGVDGPGFEALALEIFRYQEAANPVYREFVAALGIRPGDVNSLGAIPFLPVSFFKSKVVLAGAEKAETVFESSGTTGKNASRHFVKDISLYEESFRRGFELFYGPVEDWCILGLLPSYLERGNSSLIYMVDQMIRQTGVAGSGFYLDDFQALHEALDNLAAKQKNILLIGVSYALLDFGEQYAFPLKNTVMMETGGMKGRRKEMVREELHSTLKRTFHMPSIHSEYGMTELLSQAYSSGNGRFRCPPWMKILIREEDDPLSYQGASFELYHPPRRGAINIIDLANIYSCSFIATDDIGQLYHDGSFEVQGRVDSSDLRGCNLLIA